MTLDVRPTFARGRRERSENKRRGTMLLTQQFKTFEGAEKRARFERTHCNNRYHYDTIRFLNGKRDSAPFDPTQIKNYTWCLDRRTKIKA
jgi:hypothetical protein